jgi:hypothetical protein
MLYDQGEQIAGIRQADSPFSAIGIRSTALVTPLTRPSAVSAEPLMTTISA